MSEVTEFPKSIEGFGYKFNEKGELRNIDTNEKFLFNVKPQDHFYNQENYEALGEVIGEYIENELVEKYNLVRKIIPVESEDDDNAAKSRIYQSDDAQECQTLLLLIQGSGVVRPGQWARQVIINDSLELGTMFPYIRKAQELKWGIIIFNPNENYQSDMKDGEIISRRISGSESPLEHCQYVWDKFVKNAKAEKILIVAHSYGGICTTHMLDYFDEFKSRVKGIALTDSVHSSEMIPTHSRKWFRVNTINWIKSTLPLGEHVSEAKQHYGCECFSAGHPKHEYTSGTAIEIVFEYLQGRSEKKCRKVTNQENETDKQSNNEDTTATEESRIDSAMEVVDELPLEKDITVIEDSTMEIADESPINTQTQEISSVPFEPQLDSMEIVDESPKAALDSAMEVVDESQNAVPPEKDTTEKLQLMTSGTDPKIIGQQEPFTNDNEPQKEKVVVNYNTILVESNTSENQVVITEDVPKEIETYSTSVQQTKDDNISKESSQDHNLQKKADNLSTSDHMNNFKGNEENINI